ncbi:MAG TPA: hypothetical protein VHC63_18120 [Acidimicrobiales bacterium]|nr:hypothetical protein [Acidimicrobiales bacterium]
MAITPKKPAAKPEAKKADAERAESRETKRLYAGNRNESRQTKRIAMNHCESRHTV